MLAPEFVQAEILTWLKEDRPNMLNQAEFYPVLAKKIIEAYELYKKSVLDYNGPKPLDFNTV